jgi:glutaconyl-CoA/methylmalonyl-CoA decarboxylase subunit delta
MKILTITFDLSLIDQYTLVIAIAGYCIVLIALALIAYFFTHLHSVQDFLAKRRLAAQANAAIAAALYLFFSELHDEEKYVMTIRKVSKTYSPWSSKIYGIWNTMK